MQAITLMDFQDRAVERIEELFSTVSRVLLQSATASGKTVIGGQVVKNHVMASANNNVLVLLNLQVLVGQTYDTLKRFGLSCSVLHDEIKTSANGERLTLDYKRNILISMPETFLNTVKGENDLHYDKKWKPTLILIDEAHKATSALYQAIRNMFPDALILGLTATPHRAQSEEGEELYHDDWYSTNLVTTISVRELIEIGRLVQPKYFNFTADDHMVNTWQNLTDDSLIKSTIVFTRDTQHSLKVKEAFLAAGVTAEIITAGSDVDPNNKVTSQTPLQRQRIYGDFDAGKIDVLISVNALCEGFDSPRAKYCFLARGVGNIALYHQMIGRTLRAYEGKDFAVIADFFGNIEQHGYIEDYQWSLEAPTPRDIMFLKDREISLASLVKKSSVFHCCENCNHVYDIKRNAKCGHCQVRHTINVVSKVSERVSNDLGITDKKYFEIFKTQVRGAKTNVQFQEVLNKRFGRELFIEGDLHDDLKYIDVVVSRNMGWTDKLATLA